MTKKIYKMIAFLLSAVLVVGSVSIVFAEADNNTAADQNAAPSEEMTTVSEEAETGEETGVISETEEAGDVQDNANEAAVSEGESADSSGSEIEEISVEDSAAVADSELTSDGMMGISNVEEFTDHPSYKSIILTWKPVEGATGYVIERKIITRKNTGKTVKKGSYKVIAKNTKGKELDGMRSYTDKNLKKYNYYYYRIKAIKEVNGKKVESEKYSVIKKAQPVRNYYQTITFKAGATLHSHDGSNKTHYFKAGQTVISEGFGQGKYRFYYDGTLYYGTYIRFKNCKVEYVKNDNGVVKKSTKKWAKNVNKYDKLTAESFVNSCKKASNTKYLIWVSTYHQHIYIFKGKKGNWKLYKDWEVSTGKAASPTPSGFNKKIKEHVRRYSGIDYWCHFQSYNSIHAKRSYYVIGSPESHGCVRNFNENGKWIYENCKNGTGLIIF